MAKRTLTSDEIINEIAEILREGDGAFIEAIANQVLIPEVTYEGDSIFTHTTEEDHYEPDVVATVYSHVLSPEERLQAIWKCSQTALTA